MTTTVTLVYDLPVTGPIPAAALAAKFGAVLIDSSFLQQIGIPTPPTSDTPSVVSATLVRRTLVFSTLPIFVPFTPIISYSQEVQGTIVSSSSNDTGIGGVGSGAQRVRVHFSDAQGIPGYTDAIMNGTTPVQLLSTKLFTFESIEILQAGVGGTNDGLIQIFTGPGINGQVEGQLLNNFSGSILSTSVDDNGTGVGAQTVLINYTDKLSAAHSVTVTLNGQTPVPLGVSNVATITNMTVASAGAVTSNIGTITVMSGPDGTGGPAGRLLPSLYASFPPTTDVMSPFRDLFTNILASAMASKVTAATPVFA